jgi:hypothetical protein
MVVLFNRESLEPPLPDMAAAPVTLAVTVHVSCQQPLHPRTQVAIAIRPQHQVEVVGHQAKAHEPHRQPGAGLLQQPHEIVGIVGIMEDLGAAVATIKHVVTIATHRCSRCPRHARIIAVARRPDKQNQHPCPTVRAGERPRVPPDRCQVAKEPRPPMWRHQASFKRHCPGANSASASNGENNPACPACPRFSLDLINVPCPEWH